MKWSDVSQYDKGYPPPEPREDVEALRATLEQREVLCRELVGERDALLARLEQTERVLEIYRGAAGRPMTAEEHDALDALASSEGGTDEG